MVQIVSEPVRCDFIELVNNGSVCRCILYQTLKTFMRDLPVRSFIGYMRAK